MRLAELRNFKFSNLNFYHYFFTAYIGLHATFSLLLGNITVFAPDETVYKSIFARLYSAGFTSDVLGFNGSWEPWLRLVYLPAKLMTYVGISDLMAARFLAITYSALATYLVIRIAKDNDRDERVFKIAIIAISFIPTVFLWSSIGLRESFLYLEISAILFCFSRIRNNIDYKNTLLLGFALFSLAMTKNYIYILFLFGTLITLALFSVINRKNLINHALVLSLALLPLAVNPTLVPAISGYLTGQLAKPESSLVGDINNDGRCDTTEFCNSESDGAGESSEGSSESEVALTSVATGGMTVHALFDQLQNNPNTIIARIANIFGVTSKLGEIARANIVLVTDEQVAENKKKLSLKQAGLKHFDQVVLSSVKFLFIPFIFIDNGSLFLNIQSIETPIWLFIYGLFFVGFYQIIRRRREFDYAVMIATLFALEFVAISALTEINVGTALRHRSLLLIPILVIWLARKKTEVRKIN